VRAAELVTGMSRRSGWRGAKIGFRERAELFGEDSEIGEETIGKRQAGRCGQGGYDRCPERPGQAADIGVLASTIDGQGIDAQQPPDAPGRREAENQRKAQRQSERLAAEVIHELDARGDLLRHGVQLAAEGLQRLRIEDNADIGATEQRVREQLAPDGADFVHRIVGPDRDRFSLAKHRIDPGLLLEQRTPFTGDFRQFRRLVGLGRRSDFLDAAIDFGQARPKGHAQRDEILGDRFQLDPDGDKGLVVIALLVDGLVDEGELLDDGGELRRGFRRVGTRRCQQG
jgi:hypothetical protein